MIPGSAGSPAVPGLRKKRSGFGMDSDVIHAFADRSGSDRDRWSGCHFGVPSGYQPPTPATCNTSDDSIDCSYSSTEH